MDILIEPDLGAYSLSDFKKAEALIKEGYRAAESKIPEIKEMIQGRSGRKKKKHPLRRFLDWLRG